MIRCPFCGLEVKDYNYKFAISHTNCTSIHNLGCCHTEEDFIRHITDDIESKEDAKLLRLNLKCATVYMLNKKFSGEFITNVINGCNKHLNKFKPKKKLDDTARKIVNGLLKFESTERTLIIDKVKSILWHEYGQ